MALCDVCAGTTAAETVPEKAFRAAVRAGYDPFAMGAHGPALEQVSAMARIVEEDPTTLWRRQNVEQHPGDWEICTGCLPALRPYLDGMRRIPRVAGNAPTTCSKCGGHNPASQWHCSHCGHVQWGLITTSLVFGFGLLLWGFTVANWLGRGAAFAFGALFLWIGVTSIRDARRDRNPN